MALFSMWQELENRVFKTRFIIQKNFKHLPSPSTASPHRSDQIRERESDQREGDQIRERERVRSERGRPDKGERKSQIREGEKEIAQARLGRTTWGSRDPGRATWVTRPRPRDLGYATQVTPAWVARPQVMRAWVYFFFFVNIINYF